MPTFVQCHVLSGIPNDTNRPVGVLRLGQSASVTVKADLFKLFYFTATYDKIK